LGLLEFEAPLQVEVTKITLKTSRCCFVTWMQHRCGQGFRHPARGPK